MNPFVALPNSGTLEKAKATANHTSARTCSFTTARRTK